MTVGEKPTSRDLLKAIQIHDINRVRLLLEQGADPNEKYFDTNSTDPLLHCAVVSDKSGELVKLLVAYGAKLDVKNHNDLTPLMYAVCYNNIPAIRFLIEKGASIDNKDRFDRTALSIASEGDGKKVIAQIINDAIAQRQQLAEERKILEFRNTAAARQAALNSRRPKVILKP